MKRFLSIVLMLCIIAHFPLQAAAQTPSADGPSDYFISVMRLAFTDQDRSKIVTPSGEDMAEQFFELFSADYQQDEFLNMYHFYRGNGLSLQYSVPEDSAEEHSVWAGSRETVNGKVFVYQIPECVLTGREGCEVGYYLHYSYIVNNNEGIILDADDPTFEMLYTSFDSAVSWDDAAIEYQDEILNADISSDETFVSFYMNVKMAVYIRMITGDANYLPLTYRFPLIYEHIVYA